MGEAWSKKLFLRGGGGGWREVAEQCTNMDTCVTFQTGQFQFQPASKHSLSPSIPIWVPAALRFPGSQRWAVKTTSEHVHNYLEAAENADYVLFSSRSTSGMCLRAQAGRGCRAAAAAKQEHLHRLHYKANSRTCIRDGHAVPTRHRNVGHLSAFNSLLNAYDDDSLLNTNLSHVHWKCRCAGFLVDYDIWIQNGILLCLDAQQRYGNLLIYASMRKKFIGPLLHLIHLPCHELWALRWWQGCSPQSQSQPARRTRKPRSTSSTRSVLEWLRSRREALKTTISSMPGRRAEGGRLPGNRIHSDVVSNCKLGHIALSCSDRNVGIAEQIYLLGIA